MQGNSTEYWSDFLIDSERPENETRTSSATDGMEPPKRTEKSPHKFLGIVIFIIIICFISVLVPAFIGGIWGLTVPPKVVKVTADQPDNSTIIVTYQGGKDSRLLKNIVIVVTDDRHHQSAKTLSSSGSMESLTVGENATFTGKFDDKNLVIVNGVFSDGTAQDLLFIYV